MNRILIINGPNLNLLGRREPDIYGKISMNDYMEALVADYPSIEIEYFQSNHEGDLIDTLHEAGFDENCLGIVLNAGAYTHTSLALGDAIRSIETPVVEVHISNVFSREEVRRHSFISDACKGVISGFGLDSYRLAIEAILAL
ncbi:MAG: type II 3-dehydroquinate dehydratase [Muribaculaceae bacterium]|nr:type II 3-dehydroquinate dehydratase [Muribaculaceae bacterium]